MTTNRGWDKPEGDILYHFFDKNVSLCGHWMSYWLVPEREVDSPENCLECIKLINKEKTHWGNPLMPGTSPTP